MEENNDLREGASHKQLEKAVREVTPGRLSQELLHVSP